MESLGLTESIDRSLWLSLPRLGFQKGASPNDRWLAPTRVKAEEAEFPLDNDR